MPLTAVSADLLTQDLPDSINRRIPTHLNHPLDRGHDTIRAGGGRKLHTR